MKNLSETSLNKNEGEAVLEFKKRVEEKYPVVEFYLFGSKARKESKDTSDIDLLLVLKEIAKNDRDEVYGIADEILFDFGVDLSVKLFSKKDYTHLKSIPSVFTQLVEKEAISI